MLQLPIYQLPSNLNRFSLLDMFGSFVDLKPELAWLAVGLVGLFFIVASFILSYHWKRFGLDRIVMAKASLVYFFVAAVLIVVMVGSLAVYINSL